MISEVGRGPDRPDQLLMAARSPTVTLSSMKMPSRTVQTTTDTISGLGRIDDHGLPEITPEQGD
jgi:hypothetical protein